MGIEEFDRKVWACTVLLAVKKLDIWISSLDSDAKNLAAYSFWDRGISFDKVLDITERKRRLIALRLLIKDVLRELSAGRKSALLGYFGGTTIERVAQERKISLRTAYREVCRGINEVVGGLNRRGCNADWFVKNWGNEPYLQQMYKRASKKLKEGRFFYNNSQHKVFVDKELVMTAICCNDSSFGDSAVGCVEGVALS